MKINKIFLLTPCLLAFSSLFGCNKNNTEWTSKEDWFKNTSQATKDDIGKTAKVKVNGVDHLVRLIDIDHDIDESGNKIHTTWEFVNIISDENGDSIAYQWNDTLSNSSSKAINIDFINSTIRYALTGQGNNGGQDRGTTILAGTKGGTNWENSYKNKTVLSMLPEDLRNNLKTVKKTVGITDDPTTEYKETEYTDKLFLPSAIEYGYDDEYCDKGYGKTYQYYAKAKKTSDSIRAKAQVNSKIFNKEISLIEAGAGQMLNDGVTNYAGYNYKINNSKLGGKYWLRSPFIPDVASPEGDYVWYCDCDGELLWFARETFDSAFGVAPLFCI